MLAPGDDESASRDVFGEVVGFSAVGILILSLRYDKKVKAKAMVSRAWLLSLTN
jgi:hypothetical protein